MKVQKVVRAQGDFARKGEDIVAGDKVLIKSEGQWIEGQYGQQFVIQISTRNGDKNVNFNQTTINILHDQFGEDTASWIGKEVLVRMKKDVVANKKVDIYYFVTPNWDFDEYRELVNTTKAESQDAKTDGDYPQGEVNVDDIPF